MKLKRMLFNIVLFVQIQLFSGSHIMFQNNSAKVGGAISVFAPILYKDTDLALSFNALCFIQYEVLISDKLAAKEWNVNFVICIIFYYVAMAIIIFFAVCVLN